MFFRFLWKTLKIFIIAYLVLLVIRPSGAKALIDCDVSDGSISIAGNEIAVENSEAMQVLSGIEEKASALIPNSVSKLLSEVSEWFSETFGGENASGEK